MSNKNYLVVVLIALLVFCLCGLCISISLVAASPIFLGAGDTMTIDSQATVLPEVRPGSWLSTPLPSPTSFLSPADRLSSTPRSTATITVPIEGAPSEDGASSSTLTETQVLEAGVTYAPSPTTGSLAMDSWCIPWNSESTRTQVHAVIDGVTIEVMIDGVVVPVHYIGVEIPDFSGDPDIWTSAKEKNRELVEGKNVLLIKDRSEVDSEGRLLRYVLSESVFINRQLVESGYAIAVSSSPDISCHGIFQEAEKLARATGRGLWAPTSTPSRIIPTHTSTPALSGDVIIVKIFSEGTIWQEPEEYVEIFNDGSQPVQLQDWTIEDIKSHVFVFPSFVLGSHQYCRVYTDLYLPEHCGFTYYSLSPIWDNNGDCAYLKDGDGILIDMYCYE